MFPYAWLNKFFDGLNYEIRFWHDLISFVSGWQVVLLKLLIVTTINKWLSSEKVKIGQSFHEKCKNWFLDDYGKL